MSLRVPSAVLTKTAAPALQRFRETAKSDYPPQVQWIPVSLLTQEVLADLGHAADAVGDRDLGQAVAAIASLRDGEAHMPVPNMLAFPAMLELWLETEPQDGWIYARERDVAQGALLPRLVVRVEVCADIDKVVLHTRANISGRNVAVIGTYAFGAGDVLGETVAAILEREELYRETAALRGAYFHSMERHVVFTTSPHAKQFWLERSGQKRRVVLAAPAAAPAVLRTTYPVQTDPADPAEYILGAVPELPIVEVFDLETLTRLEHVNTATLTPYSYDPGAGDKLLLPAKQRVLLDAVLGKGSEGRATGIVLCAGAPGLGKRTTAVMAAERLQRPLMRIRPSHLLAKDTPFEKTLSALLTVAVERDCVVLLEDVGVYSATLDGPSVANVVALEHAIAHHPGLLFMTTSSLEGLGERLRSRCTLILDYYSPEEGHYRAHWHAALDKQGFPQSDEGVQRLMSIFPSLTPRRIHHLVALTARVARQQGRTPDPDMFMACSDQLLF